HFKESETQLGLLLFHEIADALLELHGHRRAKCLSLRAHFALLRLHPSHRFLHSGYRLFKLRSGLSMSTLAGISGREISVVLPTTPSPLNFVSTRPSASRSRTYFQNWVWARGFCSYSSMPVFSSSSMAYRASPNSDAISAIRSMRSSPTVPGCIASCTRPVTMSRSSPRSYFGNSTTLDRRKVLSAARSMYSKA